RADAVFRRGEPTLFALLPVHVYSRRLFLSEVPIQHRRGVRARALQKASRLSRDAAAFEPRDALDGGTRGGLRQLGEDRGQSAGRTAGVVVSPRRGQRLV